MTTSDEGGGAVVVKSEIVDAELWGRAERFCADLREQLAGGAAEPGRAGDAPRAAAAVGEEVALEEALLAGLLAAAAAPALAPPALAVGQLWLAEPTVPGAAGAPLLVLVTRAEPAHLRLLLMSEALWLADQHDVLVPASASPTGLGLVGCTFREVDSSAELLREHLGELTGEGLRGLLLWLRGRTEPGHERRLLGALSRRELAGGEEALRTLLRWELRAPSCETATVVTGVTLVGPDDPRRLPRALLLEASSYLETALEGAPVPQVGAAAPTVERSPSWWRRVCDAVERFGGELVLAPAGGALGPTFASAGVLRGPGAEDGTAVAPEGVVFRVDVGRARAELRLGPGTTAGYVRVQLLAHGREDGAPVAGLRLSLCGGAADAGAALARETDALGVVLPFEWALPVDGRCRLGLASDGEERVCTW